MVYLSGRFLRGSGLFLRGFGFKVERFLSPVSAPFSATFKTFLLVSASLGGQGRVSERVLRGINPGINLQHSHKTAEKAR